MAQAITHTSSDAMAIALPDFLPRRVPTRPTMPNTMPMRTKKNEKLLTMGTHELTRPMMPKTRATMAAADLGWGCDMLF